MFCCIYRWRAEKEMDDYGRVQHPKVLQHLQECQSCQAWYESLTHIEHSLKGTSFDVSDSRIEDLQIAIQRRLANRQSSPVTSRSPQIRRFPFARIAVAAAAMIVIVAALCIFLSDRTTQSSTDNRIAVEYGPSGIENYPQNGAGLVLEQLRNPVPILTSLPEQLIESEKENIQNRGRKTIKSVQGYIPKHLLASISLGAAE